MTPRTWTIELDMLGRPTTQNAVHRMHHHQASADRKRWRHAGCILAAPIPPLAAITIESWGRYPNGRSLPDADAIAPALKGVIDGLVDAGVIPDDTGKHLPSITYLAPMVAQGSPAALLVKVTEWTPEDER